LNTIEQVRLGVTELHVSSFKRSLPFYTDILGFTLLEQTDSTVTLGSNAKEPIILRFYYLPEKTWAHGWRM